jgi:Putative DNA-binding domain
MYPEGFTLLFREIGAGHCKIALSQLADRLNLDSALGMLGQIAKIREILELHNLQIVPDLDKGEIDAERILRFKPVSLTPAERLRQDLLRDECHHLEFKSTLHFDLQSYQRQGEPKDPATCRSDDVLFSSLKTVAALLNSEGGRLYIGISDERQMVGLGYDFKISATCNWDRWERYLRDNLGSKFKDGQMVNDHISVLPVAHDELCIALVDIVPRSSLSFIKWQGQDRLYRRQGNRTIQVGITEMEEFLQTRWNIV